jgi:hypothetical protein
VVAVLSACLEASGNEFAGLHFTQSGVVRRDMVFRTFPQACLYVETPTEWSSWRKPFPYLYRVIEPETGRATTDIGDEQTVPDVEKLDPPLGMRSAVVLGGLGAGSVELRADGSLHDWNIFNNHPMNRTPFGRKVQLEEALFGVRVEGDGVSARTWALRTHAPGDLPSIEQIEYSGSFPVSRLTVLAEKSTPPRGDR